MQQYNEFLYDYLGNCYQRKNKFIIDYINLQKKLDSSNTTENLKKVKEELSDLNKNRNNHHYINSLNEFKNKEKLFKKALITKKQDYKNKLLNENVPKKIVKYKVMLLEAEYKYDFYKDYVELSYDAQLQYMDSEVVKNQIGSVITHLEDSIKSLNDLKNNKSSLLENLDPKFSYSAYKNERKHILNNKIRSLKSKYKEGIILKKALRNEMNILKIEHKSILVSGKCNNPKEFKKQLIKLKRYEINKVSKQKMKILNENRNNVRRLTPIETEKTFVFNAYLGLLFPGVGQLLNKQYVKSILFLIGTFFIYFMAIPYSLGLGNYQGNGLFGLFNLAEGAARTHKSIIYMIEGIIALCLLIISILIFIFSFKDSLNVEKDEIKGTRSKKWIETKTNITENGFPYLVSLPSLIVIVFIVIVPIVTSIMLSFTNMNPQHQGKFQWIGLENYLNLIRGKGMVGSVFWNIFGWTIIWTLGATTLAIVVGFTLALIVNSDRIKGKKLFRTIFLLPWAVPGFISIMFFSIMLSREGILTQLINNFTGLSLDIKNNAFQSRIAIVLLQTWLGSAYVFLLSTGVLQSIPNDLYEAADIDGATIFQKLKRITIPIVLFQTAPLLIGQYVFNFNNFSLIYLFNGGGPFNPKLYGNLAGSTDLLISYIYKLTIDNQQQAIGAAISVIISFGLMIFTYIGFKNSKAFKEEKL